MIAAFAKFTEVCRGSRRLGSAALDLAYVAAGRLDGFWERGLKPWDVAAGVLLVEEAGGIVSRFDGGPHQVGGRRGRRARRPRYTRRCCKSVTSGR